MPQEWVRRDVQIAITHVRQAEASVDTLRKMTNLPESVRALSVALTQLETARLFLTDVAGRTPESL